MDIRDIISKIQNDQITIIQEEVPVQFDNRQQTPLGFKWQKRHYEVLKPIMVSNRPGGHPGYLILTDGGVFNLTLVRDKEASKLCKSRWVLKYRINDDTPSETGSGQDRPPLLKGSGNAGFSDGPGSLFVPLPLVNIARYHGHLCPELAVGYRVGLTAQKELGLTRDTVSNFFILAENMTSAIDALQYMTGCTIGNQRFYAYDLGKHVYYFGRFHDGPEPGEAMRVALVNPLINLGGAHYTEKRIMAGQAASAEVEEYQHAIDKSVSEILNIHEENLFVRSKVSLRSPQVNYSSDYDKCSCCGEVVAVKNAMPGEKGLLCQICVSKML